MPKSKKEAKKKPEKKQKGKPKTQKHTRVYLIIAFTAIILVSIALFSFKSGLNSLPFEYIVVEERSLLQEVSVTGKVKANEEVNLAFEQSGKIASIFVDVNDIVEVGDALFELQNADVRAELNESEAKLASAQAKRLQFAAALQAEEAKLQEFLKGTRIEELQISETVLSNAEISKENAERKLDNAKLVATAEEDKKTQDLSDAQRNLDNVIEKADADIKNTLADALNVLNDAYTTGDDALHGQLSVMIESSFGRGAELTFSTENPNNETDAEVQFNQAENAMASLLDLLDDIDSSDIDEVNNALMVAKSDLNIAKTFLQVLARAVDDAFSISEATSSNYRSYITAARSSVESSLSEINSQIQFIRLQSVSNQNAVDAAQTEVNAAESALQLQRALNANNISLAENELRETENDINKAGDELLLKQSGSRIETISAQQASVDQAKANVSVQIAEIKQAQATIERLQAQLEKTVMTSPISGIITKQEAELGETVSANEIVASIISDNTYEIESNVPEADIAKISLDNIARITLDAFGPDQVFQARVFMIDPAETVIDGVSTYKVKLVFLNDNDRIKSGMTANIDIVTAQKDSAFTLPRRAISSEDGQKIIRLLDDNDNVQRIEVATGLTGSDGRIEITAGLSTGDRVIIGDID